MTSPDEFPTPDTTTPAPTEADVRIRPVPGQQQETARLLLAAAGDDPQLVRYHPPHFIVPKEVAEDAGLLELEAPSPHVVSHDRTVPFPPLYPGREEHTMTPLSPPGERALTVAPDAGTRDGLRPAEAPGDFLPDAADDQVRSWDSTGHGESEGNVTGRRSAHSRPEVLADNAGLTYPNVFAHTNEDDRGRTRGRDKDAKDAEKLAKENEKHDAAALREAEKAQREADREAAKKQREREKAEREKDDDDEGSPVEQEPAEPVEPPSRPPSIDEMTVAEIEAGLADGSLTPADVRSAELAGKNRKGVLALVEE